MFAAPSIFEQPLIDRIPLMTWKDKIQHYIFLENELKNMSKQQLEQVQKCFLVMLDESNLNVLNKVFSVIREYGKEHQIEEIALGGLVSKILNFYNIHVLKIQEIIAGICQKSNKGKILQAIGSAFTAKSPKRVSKSYQVLTYLIKQFGLSELVYLQGAIQDISAGFLSNNDEVKQSVFQLMKMLYSKAGSCILEYAKFMRYPMLNNLQKFADKFIEMTPFQIFPQRMLYKQFSFLEKYTEDFLDQVILLKAKQLNQCLKEMKQDSQKKNLKQDNFISILSLYSDLAKRQTPSLSRSILSILNNLTQRLISFQQYSQILVQIIFDLVACKQLNQVLNRSPIHSFLRFEHVQSKLTHLQQNQAQYHKAIKLFKLLYSILSQYQKQTIYNHLNNLNINYVYRIELETLHKK